MQRYLNGELHFRYAQQELRYTLLPERPQPLGKAKKTRQRRDGVKPYVPPREHAWRRFQFGRSTLATNNTKARGLF